jgi:hypothetical protein
MNSQTVAAPQTSRAISQPKRGFLRNWYLSKAIVFVAWVVFPLIEGFYGSVAATQPGWMAGAGAFLLYLAVCMWLAQDRRTHSAIAEQYGSFALYLFWPVLMPIYVLHTRGWRRTLVAWAFFVAIFWVTAQFNIALASGF